MTSKVAAAMLFAIGSKLRELSEVERGEENLPKVSKHHRGAEDHRGWIGSIGTHDI